MSTADISRHSFDPRKQYASVGMQQGRVILDDDWNENERISAEARRKALLDVVGVQGSPDDGFRISNATGSGGGLDFTIEPGAFYLGGIRLRLDRQERFRSQLNWLQQPAGGIDPEHGRIDAVYLEAWRQSVTAVEDSELLEVALGGPDTSTRVRDMYRVRLARGVESPDCAQAWARARQVFSREQRGQLNEEGELITGARLSVIVDPGVVSDDPCDPSITGGYLGAENQAIRVQVVAPGLLTWGFDNGSALYRVRLSADRSTVTFETESKDQAHWPLAGDVVELLPWSAVLSNGEKLAEHQGHLTKLASSYNPDDSEVTLSAPPAVGFGQEWQERPDAALLGEEYFYLRVWHRGGDRSADAAIPFASGDPVTLGHTGLSVTLTDGPFRPGDYWIIAARPNSPAQVVPWELSAGMPAVGPRVFTAPLALIQWRRRGRNFVPEIISDCRARFLPLTSPETCSTYTVGDGSRSRGHFASIQAAVDALPLAGGNIHVLPGLYEENVRIGRRRNIIVHGCGPGTVVRSPEGSDDPVFRVRDSRNVALKSMAIENILGIGVQLEQAGGTEIEAAEELRTEELASAEASAESDVRPSAVANVASLARLDLSKISRGAVDLVRAINTPGLFENIAGTAVKPIPDDVVTRPPSALEGILLQDLLISVRDRQAIHGQGGDDITVDNCQVRVGQLAGDMSGESDAGRWPAIFLTCDDLLIRGNSVEVDERAGSRRTAMGGIQVGGGSDRVRILENTITGGNGRGITLGSIVYIPQQHKDLPREDFTRFLQVAIFLPPGLNIIVDGRGCVTWTLNPQPPADDVGDPLIPASTGSLSEVEIKDNRISSMAGSGISAAHFFDPAETADCITVNGLRIRDNIIRNCLQGDVAEASISARTFGAFGGVTLGAAIGLEMRNNVIEANGLSHINPVCGVFALYTEGAVFDDNRITGNGPRSNTDAVPRAGNRGGIVIAYATPPTSGTQPAASVQLSVLTAPEPAVRIHRNVVIAPEGRALRITASGEVVVQHNSLSSQGHGTRRSHGRLNSLSASGNLSSLAALNVDLSQANASFGGAGLAEALADLTGGAAVSINVRGLAVETPGEGDDAPSKGGAGGVAVPSGGQERPAEPRKEDAGAAETQGKSERIDTGIRINASDQPAMAAASETAALARARQASTGRTAMGSVMFTGNQVSLALSPNDSDTPASAVIVTSIGDVTLSDNQIDASVPATQGFINTLVFGATVRVLGNRFNEPITRSRRASMLSAATIAAALNITTGNEGAHCIYAYRRADSNVPRVIDQPNLSFIELIDVEACGRLLSANVAIAPVMAVQWPQFEAMRTGAAK
ncbi:MAG: DUF6519 domain-containing protein [Dehalococcoidia bacterium]